ncbi:hypothetical protein NDU88_006764 [Pleurodeles waltl]|uniref:Uncharacterized protein n=1 Tax=Pleurodeles waltl TaxID=8319 RepID=A0AAV7VMT9_PLEWA|nr:hypothetical protein NDU88_006764 [Pleurodeles waltl]
MRSDPARAGELCRPTPGPRGGEGAWGEPEDPWRDSARGRRGGRSPLEQDATLDSTHADGRGSDRGPDRDIQQADTMEEPTIKSQARLHIERKKAGPDLCTRNQQQVGSSQQVDPS